MGNNIVQSVARAMQLIDCMAGARKPLSLQEISQLTGFPKSTVHAILSTLRESNVVKQSDADGKYRLGVRLFKWGNVVSSSWEVLNLAKPHLYKIAGETSESCSLGMLDKDEIVYIDSTDSQSAMRIVTIMGTRIPCHCSAMGKAILACKSNSELSELVGPKPMKALTPNTITDLEALREDLSKARHDGAATEDGEYRAGIRGVASAIRNASGSTYYAIGVSGLFRNTTDEAFTYAREMVKQAAQSISQELGFQG